MYSSIDILFKRVVCALSIFQSDHLLTVLILLFLTLTPIVPLLLTVLLLLKQLRTFPHFQLFVIFHFTLLRRLFFNRIPFQKLLLIPFITLFPLKILFFSLLTPSLPLSVHSFLFGLERRLQTLDSKQTCTIIALLPSFSNLLCHNIPHSHIFSITLCCFKKFVILLISRHKNNVFATIRTLGHCHQVLRPV